VFFFLHKQQQTHIGLLQLALAQSLAQHLQMEQTQISQVLQLTLVVELS
jgi:hypothetical protein